MKTFLCMRVPEELYEELVKALLEDTEWPLLKIGITKVTGCEVSKDKTKQFIYAKPESVVRVES